MILFFIFEINILVFEFKFWLRLILIFFFGIVDVCVRIVVSIKNEKKNYVYWYFLVFDYFIG